MARRKNDDNVLPIRDLLFHCIDNWYWILLSLAIAMGAAAVYILSSPPVYVRSAEILIKESDGMGGSGAFKDFATQQATADARIEVQALRSPGIVREAIKRLGLTVDYRGEGRFYNGIMYLERPITVTFIDLRESDVATFTANLTTGKNLALSGFCRNGQELEGTMTAVIGDTVATPVGRIVIETTGYYNNFIGQNIFVEKRNLDEAISSYCSNLTSTILEETSIVKLRLKDYSTVRATELLNAIIDIYNEQWVARNNESTIKTIKFITQRVDSLQIELNLLDREIAAQNSKNKLTAKQIRELNSTLSSKDNEKSVELESQIELALFIKKCVIENVDNKEMLPAKTGLSMASIENLITKYNQEIVKRDKYLSNSSEANPLVIDCNKNLVAMHKSINDALDSHIGSLRKEISLIDKEETTSKVQFSKEAEHVKDIQGLLRQQKIKNTLYLFLLQKLEESELSKEYEASNNRLLTPVGGSNTPIEPMQRQIIMLALAIGLLLPVTIIFIREITNKKVRGRKDLEGIDIPLIGEIPLNGQSKDLKDNARSIIVKEGNRNIINEAFRVLRTNLEFMNNKDESSTVFIVTSFNPGSGKTFLTMNIAAGLALKGKKVLVIDGDMRHGSTSAYVGSPSTGLSDYLSGGTADVSSIIAEFEEYPTLNVIPIGSTPPNPTELLHGKRFGELVNSMRQHFDYIFIDCPPIDIVADTQIIEEHADRTIFVVRAGLLNRDMLDELEDIHESKRFKSISMILNGTYGGGTGYRYKYGYSYGYRYGYKYGYGYGYYHSKK